MERCLRASHLFTGVDERLVGDLAKNAVRRKFERGEVLWRSGQEARTFSVIASGLVKVVQPSADGHILGIFGPHESVDDLAALEPGTYPADAVAATREVEVLSVARQPVLEAMERDVRLLRSLNRSLFEHLQALRHKIRIITAGSVERRLATLLLHLSDRFGDETADGALSIPVVLARAELACLVGTTPETTTRIMTRWQRGGLAQTTPDGFVLQQPEVLESIAREESA
jgi:CRP-like cAMP-binding protein